MPRDVFVSYAHEDQAIADKVLETLEAKDVKCWISSRDELPGEDWAETIVRGMDESKIIVFIHSAHSNYSDACAQELAIAHEKRKLIIPVRVEDVELARRLQYRLVGRQRIDALTPPIEAHLDKLIDAVRGYIKRVNAEDKSAPAPADVNVVRVSQQDIVKKQAPQKSQQAQAWVEKATRLCTLSLYPDALKCYDKAIEIRPHDATTLNSKGLVLTDLGRHEEALRCFEQAAAADPEFLEVIKNKGKSLQKLLRFDEAVKAYDNALDVDPVNAETRALKCSALLELNRDEEALVCCEAAARLEPDNPNFLYDTAMCYARQGRHEESLENLNKALEIDPDNIHTLHQKGNILSILDRDEEAVKTFDAALATGSESVDIWYAKGVTFAKLGKHVEAIQCYEEALNIDHTDERALQQKAISEKYLETTELLEQGNKLAAEGQHEEAIYRYNEIIERDPRNVEAFYVKGIAFSELDNATQAIRCFDDVLAIDPQHVGAIEGKADVKRKLEQKEELQRQATTAISTSNKQIGVEEVNAHQTAQHPREESPQQAFEVTEQPPVTEAASSPAPEVLSPTPNEQQSRRAGTIHEEADKSKGQSTPTPEQGRQFMKLGTEFQSKGSLGNARVYFEKALTNDLQCYDSNDSVLAVRYSNLGTVLRAMRDLRGARANFEKALAIDESSCGRGSPAVAKHCNNLGIVCHAQDDLDTAWEYYKRALTIYRKSLGDNSPRAEAVRNNIKLLAAALEAQQGASTSRM